ncbi:MAG: hypothetical protein HYY06_25335 [Deltaproteobacteria bacterium]|nr:hypothetical protein [Deltaproteobacteria bacterium]
MRTSSLARVAAVALQVGCLGTVIHLDRNAPGSAALEVPPPDDLPVGSAIDPADPGERLVAVVPELTAGGGYWSGSWSAASSAQLAFFYGDRLRSHYSDDLPFGDNRVAPFRSLGAAVGFDLLAPGGGTRRLTASVRIAEAVGGAELGWGLEPGPGEHSFFLGGYIAGWARFFYVRLLYGLGRDFGFESGVALDYALTWVWSK